MYRLVTNLSQIIINLPTRQGLKATAFALAVAVLLAQASGSAATADSKLTFSIGYLVTGNYTVGSVDLHEDTNPVGPDGLSTGTISISGVPDDADIIAAYLYWETITLTSTPGQAVAKFRGHDIPTDAVLELKRSSANLVDNTATCWSSGTPLTMHQFRADVLRFLPIRLDRDNKPTGKRLVNDTDLTTQNEALHSVSLPTRNGNQIPESAGASLVIVYRNPDPTEPLRKIVIYDGIHVQESLQEATRLTLRGFYKSASSATGPKSAKLTHLIASGQPNNNERVFFNDGTNTQKSPANPITIGSASERIWSALTYDVTNQMNPGNNSAGGYGETATTTVDHSGGGGYDCLSWGAVIFSTAVEDIDQDGLPDGIENVNAVLKDPDDTPLPNLRAMGAGDDKKDIFVEASVMWAQSGTSYGSDGSGTIPYHPYSATQAVKTDSNGHHHFPTPDDILMIGDAFDRQNIRFHMDVGNVAAYHLLLPVSHSDWQDNYGSTAADKYLVGNNVDLNVAALARGGETIKEVACDATDPACHFPAFPGTVSWKFGVQLYRDWEVGDNGEEVVTTQNNTTHRRRFDPGRKDFFHYLLYAHGRATPRSLPCLLDGNPINFDKNNGTECNTVNPDFNANFYHTPTSASGIADLPGNSLLVTLGFWDEFVGRPYTRAGTTFHELGHNLGLWHGGEEPEWGRRGATIGTGTPTYIEPNCKPYFISSMSYLFQVHGLFKNDDSIHLDYSRELYPGAAEKDFVPDTDLSPLPLYQPAWFAPADSELAGLLGVSAAQRYCTGKKWTTSPGLARVHATSTAPPPTLLDWRGDRNNETPPITTSLSDQDVNLDGTVTGAGRVLGGHDDWAKVKLNGLKQVGTAISGFVPGSAEELTSQLGGIVSEISGIASEISGLSNDPRIQGIVSELSGIASEISGLPTGNGIASEISGIASELSGIASEISGIASELSGIASELSGIVSEISGIASEISGIASEISGDYKEDLSGIAAEISGQPELPYNVATEVGKSRPFQVTASSINGAADCPVAAPFSPTCHRVLVTFKAPPFGGFTSYEVQRRRITSPSSGFTTLTSSLTSTTFIDLTELPNGHQYVYRVRGLNTTDGNSEWSQPSAAVTITNNKPSAVGEGTFTFPYRETLQLSIPMLLSNDTDRDSPSGYVGRVLVVTQQPANGTLTFTTVQGTPTIVYKPNKNYSGPDSFKYRSNDGPSSDAPSVQLSDPSDEVTVSVFAQK